MTFQRMRRTVVIDSGIDTVRDLAALLPPDVLARIEPELLTEPTTAAALRLLVTVHDPVWHERVDKASIDWPPLLQYARQREVRVPNMHRVLIEIAASLAGHPGAHVVLLYAIRVLPREHLLAVMDAIRIAAEGLIVE